MAKKVFISFRFTGEDPVELKDMISNIEKSLSKGSHETYCSLVDEDFFRDNKYTNGQIMEHAFDRTDESDVMLAILKSNEKSEGMLMEVGYLRALRRHGLRDLKFVLAIKEGVYTTSMRDLADVIVEFSDLDDLYQKLSTLELD